MNLKSYEKGDFDCLSFGLMIVIRCSNERAVIHGKLTDKTLQGYTHAFNHTNDKASYQVYRKGFTQEIQYINLIDEILRERGDKPMREGRNGNTIGLFNRQMKFDISGGVIPSSSTSGGTWMKGLVVEFNEFMAGNTSSKRMEAQGVNIWRDNTSASFLESRRLDYVPGTIGPCYGHNYRHYGGQYTLCHDEYVSIGGIDQIQMLINGLITDPMSRRHIVINWNPVQNGQCPLPPCQIYFQFYVDDKKLTCFAMNRSSDICCAGMWNSGFAALLTHYIAHKTGYAADTLIMQFNDVHIYENQIELAREHVRRVPVAPFPRVQIKENDIVITEIDKYLYHPRIKYPMNA